MICSFLALHNVSIEALYHVLTIYTSPREVAKQFRKQWYLLTDDILCGQDEGDPRIFYQFFAVNLLSILSASNGVMLISLNIRRPSLCNGVT